MTLILVAEQPEQENSVVLDKISFPINVKYDNSNKPALAENFNNITAVTYQIICTKKIFAMLNSCRHRA